jgi:hypothetical protein
MMHSVFYWLRRSSGRRQAAKTCPPSRHRRSSVPQLLVLEDRTVLSVLTVLNNADSGAGSLRDTIAAAQSGDTIVFDPSLSYQTITLSSGPLALSSNLTINGPGAGLLAISGNNASRLFTLSSSAQVTLADLTLTGGMSSQGGAILIGGTAALTLDSDILSGNQAVSDANGNALGGAVYTSAGASLTVENTVFVNNQTNGTNESFGGAILNAGTLVIDAATFTDNASLGSTTPSGSPTPGASRGGAICNLDGSSASIERSTFTANQSLGNGTGDALGGALCDGATYVFPFAGSGITITVSQCSFENNTAKAGSHANVGGFGGAIENEPGVNLSVLNCSLISNQVDSGGSPFAIGGAIDDSVGDTVTISDSQFLSNSAIGSGLGANGRGGAVSNDQTLTIVNCLFTGNRAVGGPMADGNTSIGTIGNGDGGAIWSAGGLANHVELLLTLSNCIIADNEAIGGSGGTTLAYSRDDSAFGGGIINMGAGILNVIGCTITGNQAIGGASAQGSGGVAFGGGIENNNQCTLNLTNSTVSANLCQGGQGADNTAGGLAAGAGISNDRGSVAILTNSTVSLNECLGGSGGAGANGGESVGGGIANASYTFFGITDKASLIVSNCQIVDNVAQGGTEGSSAVGGDGLGGGIFVGSGTAVLQGVLISGNQAQGGVDSQGNTTGQGLGGGVYVDPSASATADMETLIAGNQASKSNNDIWGVLTIGP